MISVSCPESIQSRFPLYLMENSFAYSGTGLVTGNKFLYPAGLRPSDVPSSGRADPVPDGEVLVACRDTVVI